MVLMRRRIGIHVQKMVALWKVSLGGVDCTLVIYNIGLPVAYALYLFLSFASVTTAWNFHPKSTYKSTASSCSTMCVILPATNFPRGLPSFTKSDFRNISSNVSASELSGALKHVLLPVIFELKATQFLWKNGNVLDAFTKLRHAVAILDTNAARIAVAKHTVWVRLRLSLRGSLLRSRLLGSSRNAPYVTTLITAAEENISEAKGDEIQWGSSERCLVRNTNRNTCRGVSSSLIRLAKVGGGVN